jgi:hypothetical protein
MTRQRVTATGFALCSCLVSALRPALALGQAETLPAYTRDRGAGVPASIFGTYLDRRELVIYPFFEYTLDNNREYQPKEFALGPDVDFRGRFRSSSSQVFLGYGVTDWLALELEAAYLTAKLQKSQNDTFATPETIRQSGLTDLEAQVRARLVRETPGRPEVFGFVELVARSQRGKVLIEEANWDAKPGIGLEHKPDLGEFAMEYLKRMSPSAHLYLAVEGGEGGALDEWDLITGIRWRLTTSVDFKVDNAVGISSKATDWAPQAGLMVRLPR